MFSMLGLCRGVTMGWRRTATSGKVAGAAGVAGLGRLHEHIAQASSQAFDSARAKVDSLNKRPSNETLLRLYALYKQATVGPCETDRPSMLNMVNRAKWDAWHGLSDMPQEDAQDAYIQLVDGLVKENADEMASTSDSAAAAPAQGYLPESSNMRTEMLDNGVAHVQLTSLTVAPSFFTDLGATFSALGAMPEVNVVVLSAERGARAFSYGLNVEATMAEFGHVLMDKSRKPEMYAELKKWQASISTLATIEVPVIAAVHSHCIGAGVDIITAADIRLAARDANFSVREAQLGITADMGSLQRLPHIVGQGHTRHLALTACDVDAPTAAAMGLVAPQLADDADAVIDAALDMAQTIAANPRPAVTGTKHILNHLIDNSVESELDYVALYNTAVLDFDVISEAYIKAQKARAAAKANN
ncbi:enoyl-CoA hydratase/carnithine racemase [Thecamonas trahens ATCC 50062]|uniref:Enoyl-CoA hydratase/carnithine racemase n=1 Tax=Thecamonas trahens ATCC 50062 TaxID=461836 RepID=A0A0L0DPW3_THETB|nr:enoyl-CoA hydratase/carnithine racemase [Thecamonas trahens ATCC 50062]KNC54305.1 enoyl-CoA hydratase/carnithine racemase [Thecamonas trahens ATCC 50062]|eukprot:XP_013753766.1 enoyl-CoA hydratase/carnithine racemase [Thecamonas trahens ATCC 50062]